MKLITTIFTLGSLEVYSEEGVTQWFQGIPKDGIYWRDAGSPQGYGPFMSLTDCMRHYEYVVKTFKGDRDKFNNPRLADIIRVDFGAKKRVVSNIP